jgi:hypothetical protein
VIDRRGLLIRNEHLWLRRLTAGKLQPQESRWYHSSLEAYRPGTHEVWCSSLSPKQEKIKVPAQARQEAFSPISGGSALLLYTGLQQTKWGPLTIGKAVCFIRYRFKCSSRTPSKTPLLIYPECLTRCLGTHCPTILIKLAITAERKYGPRHFILSTWGPCAQHTFTCVYVAP